MLDWLTTTTTTAEDEAAAAQRDAEWQRTSRLAALARELEGVNARLGHWKRRAAAYTAEAAAADAPHWRTMAENGRDQALREVDHFTDRAALIKRQMKK